MDTTIPLFVALIGAGVGAYFAILKSRKERLWVDRYETLRDIVVSLETIQSSFEIAHMDEMGLSVVSTKEKERLEAEWPTARHELRRSVAKLRLLFKENQVENLVSAVTKVNVAFVDLYEGPGPDDAKNLEKIGLCANEAIEAAIEVAQKHCL